jgi:hypothetical protein
VRDLSNMRVIVSCDRLGEKSIDDGDDDAEARTAAHFERRAYQTTRPIQ